MVDNFSPEWVERAEFFLLFPPVFVFYLYFLCFYLFFTIERTLVRSMLVMRQIVVKLKIKISKGDW